MSRYVSMNLNEIRIKKYGSHVQSVMVKLHKVLVSAGNNI